MLPLCDRIILVPAWSLILKVDNRMNYVLTWSSLQDMTLQSLSDLGTTNRLDDPEVGHHSTFSVV